MTLTLGRCAGLRPNLGYPKVAGDRVQIEGVCQATTLDLLKGARQQLLGLVDNEDEDVIPCIWSSDTTFDGFYRPVSMSVEHIGPNRNRSVRFSATLQRLRDYASPLWEVSVQSFLRTNVHSITVPAHIVLVAFAASSLGSLSYPVAMSGMGGITQPTPAEQGASPVTLDRRTLATFLPTGSQYSFTQAPANFYAGSCKIERLYGASWVAVHGRSIPSTLQGQWRITNGLIRLTLGLTASANTVLEVWDQAAGAWETVNLLHYDSTHTGIGYGLATTEYPTLVTTSRVEILRNSPECVVVRHSGFLSQETFTLQRGAYHLAWTLKRSWDFVISPSVHGVKFASATASTAITAGIRSTSNDANGNRWIFASPHTMTTDLVNGSARITTDQVAPITFMLGVELAGSGAAAGNTAANVVNQFMGAVSWRQRVVAP